MYLPRHFASTDLAVLDRLAARDAFATLVTVREGLPFASHLPLLYRRDGEHVTLTGHWARGNPQWRELDGARALAILHGPHAYVSPSWYPEPAHAVPTWNYAVAHLTGTIRVSDDPAALETLVSALGDHYEAGNGSGWSFATVHPSVRRELAGIVGFTLEVERIELKLKLSQHHPEDKVRGAIAGLGARPDAGSRELAEWMYEALAARAPAQRAGAPHDRGMATDSTAR